MQEPYQERIKETFYSCRIGLGTFFVSRGKLARELESAIQFVCFKGTLTARPPYGLGLRRGKELIVASLPNAL